MRFPIADSEVWETLVRNSRRDPLLEQYMNAAKWEATALSLKAERDELARRLADTNGGRVDPRPDTPRPVDEKVSP